jgi:5-methylcytosine-specific restriction enzyme subunit McrC
LSIRSTIQVFEHQKLYYSDAGPFKKQHWKALSDYAEREKLDYYTILGKGIKFSSYVGVVQAGNLTIEVLPKTDVPDQTAINEVSKADNKEKSLWHQVLLDMLKECRLLKADSSNKAFLKLRSYSLLDIYLELFLSETEQLLHEGLIKKYRKTEGNQLALKGQLLFSKNLSQNLVHQERFYVKHTVYNTQNVFNQLLYKTLLTIPKINNSSFINDRVNRQLFAFPELADLKVSLDTFNRLVYDRKTERYRDALLISKMILLHYHPDITGGGENVVAIMFDMNKLWEEFVYRRLKKEESDYNIQVQAQQSTDFWKPSHIGYSKTIRPDIIVTYSIREKHHDEEKLVDKTVVIDTKWKMLQNLTPSDEDLKQMFVYNLFWKCDKSVLVYPAIKSDSGAGEYHHYEIPGKFINACSVEKISVLDKENKWLNPEFGYKTLKSILGATLDELKKKAD